MGPSDTSNYSQRFRLEGRR